MLFLFFLFFILIIGFFCFKKEYFQPIGRMGHINVNLVPYPIKKNLDDVNGIGNNLFFSGPIIPEKLDENCYFNKILQGITNDKASTDCTTQRLIDTTIFKQK